MTDSARRARQLMLVVIAAIVLWAGYLTLGAYLKNRDLRAPLVVAGCFATFFGVWALAYWGRLRRLERRRQFDETKARPK